MTASNSPDYDRADRVESTVVHEHVAPEPAPVIGATTQAPASAQADQVIADYGAEQRASLHRATTLITFVFGVIVTLILLRVLLRATGANEANDFAQLLYTITWPFVVPFATLFPVQQYGNAALEISSLIAAIVYALIGWGVTKLIRIVFYRPTTTEVHSSRYHRG